MEKYNIKQITLITLALMLNPVFAEEAVKKDDTEEELAMKLQNPVASLISVPFQDNWNFGISAISIYGYELYYGNRDGV